MTTWSRPELEKLGHLPEDLDGRLEPGGSDLRMLEQEGAAPDAQAQLRTVVGRLEAGQVVEHHQGDVLVDGHAEGPGSGHHLVPGCGASLQAEGE